ncbi:MAG: glycosyltransferase family 4 protein [Candidatus Sericytochromatia bacterium]
MNILMLTWEYPPRVVGGLARHSEEISEALVAGWESIDVITADHPGTPEYAQVNGVHIHRVKESIKAPQFFPWVLHLNFGMLSMAHRLMQERPIDIIHCHDWLVAHAGVQLKKIYNKPLIATMHATESGRWSGIHNEIQSYVHNMEWYLNYESWRTIVCSDAMRKEVMGNYNLPYEKIDIIPNGIKRDKFLFDFPDAWEFRRHLAADHEPLIVSVGRMVPEKGFQVMVSAAADVLQDFPNARFVIAGKGPMLEELRHRVRALGIEDRFLLPGYVSDLDLLKLLRVADVGLCPSIYEPFGIVALEVMAARTPVVVSDTGGLSGVVEHGVTGIKTYPGSPDSLAWGIKQVLYHPDWGKWMVDQAYQRLIDTFNWDIIADQTKQVYRRVAQEAGQNP